MINVVHYSSGETSWKISGVIAKSAGAAGLSWVNGTSSVNTVDASEVKLETGRKCSWKGSLFPSLFLQIILPFLD